MILLLPGCSNFRQEIGLEPTAPDEFAVQSRAPLTIPPEFSLRPPEPGAPRPQEVSSSEKAREAINAAGPGRPGDQESYGLKTPATIGGLAPDASQQVGPNSLAAKLLNSADSSAGGTVDKRETSALKNVY
ncbi:MAG TPA: DUF3035 domain-containing protein [Stellaceae bacterium]|nr:DUF3035 domain-containing protein [Stellaceae bacterium]